MKKYNCHGEDDEESITGLAVRRVWFIYKGVIEKKRRSWIGRRLLQWRPKVENLP